MKSIKRSLMMVLVVVLAIALTACGGSNNGGGAQDNGGSSNAGGGDTSGGEKLVLKAANITKPENQWSITLENIGKSLSEKTDGRISFELYPSGQLGNETDMMQQLNTGSIDVAVITTAQLSSSSDAFGAWLMPYPVDTSEQAWELQISDESMGLFETLTNENVQGLGYVTAGFRFMLATDPIDSADDLNGFKIRTTPSPTILDFWNAYNASPTPMPLTEVYTSLQTGVINGVDIDSESVISENLTEIAKEMTPSKHMYWVGAMLVNKDLWNSLSAEDQQLFQEVVLEETKKNNETVAENEANLVNNAADLGLTVHEIPYSEMEQKVNEVRQTWIDKAPEIGAFLEKADQIKNK